MGQIWALFNKLHSGNITSTSDTKGEYAKEIDIWHKYKTMSEVIIMFDFENEKYNIKKTWLIKNILDRYKLSELVLNLGNGQLITW